MKRQVVQAAFRVQIGLITRLEVTVGLGDFEPEVEVGHDDEDWLGRATAVGPRAPATTAASATRPAYAPNDRVTASGRFQAGTRPGTGRCARGQRRGSVNAGHFNPAATKGCCSRGRRPRLVPMLLRDRGLRPPRRDGEYWGATHDARAPDSALAGDRDRTVTVNCQDGGAGNGAGADLDRRCL
jgi:hypothetical protein